MPDLPVWFANTVEIVAFARDIIFLLLLLFVLIAVILLYSKVSSLLESVKRTAKSTEEMIATVNQNIAQPAASNSGVAFGVGKVVSFLLGFLKRKKD